MATSGGRFPIGAHDKKRLNAAFFCQAVAQQYHDLSTPLGRECNTAAARGRRAPSGQPFAQEGDIMNETHSTPPPSSKEKGGIGYVLLWLMGVPIPLLILFALLRGCA
jgi:hypothetical protein